MSELDLQRFCAMDDNPSKLREALIKPWVANGWEYATNGKITVRIPTTESDSTPPEGCRGYPALEAIFPIREIPESELIPWPERDICETCNGSGANGTQICSKCNGDGYFLCSECGSEAECPKCGRTGSVPRKCPDCGGENLVKMDKYYIPANNYQLISTLPILRYKENDNNPIYFRFDNGQGLVSIATINKED